MHLARKKILHPQSQAKFQSKSQTFFHFLLSFIFLALPVRYLTASVLALPVRYTQTGQAGTQTGRKLGPLILTILEQWTTRSNMAEARILE
jgi:hypothetical protein